MATPANTINPHKGRYLLSISICFGLKSITSVFHCTRGRRTFQVFPVMSADLKIKFLRMLQCPVCLLYMVPPIYQCERGHMVCSDCFFNIIKCPVCRGRKEGRCFTTENLAMQVEFPCVNEDNGCDFTAKCCAIKFHEIGCNFNHKRCPLIHLHRCKWSGTVKDLVDHFKEKHPLNIHFESFPVITVVGMSNRNPRLAMSVMSAYDTVFFLYWDFNDFSDEFRFSVCYYGYPTEEVRFWYMVCVYDGDKDREVVKMSAPSHCLRDDQKIFVEDHYVTLPFGVIPAFFNIKGDLRFVVKVLDNEFRDKY